MIKYYDTEADYKAATISESSASLVGATGSVHIDGRNVVVGIKSAVTGSIAVLDADNALHFISLDTYNAAAFPSDWTIVGVVAIGVDSEFFRGKITLINKTAEQRKWSNIYSWALTGYTLDGTDRTGVLSIRYADDTYAANHDYTISYNASTLADFVSQLNIYFKANTPFTTQDWVAKINDTGDGVDLVVSNWDYRMAAYNKASDGFTLAANLLPGIVSNQKGTRLDGVRDRGMWIINYPRAVTYLKSDIDNSTYNPTSVRSNIEYSYPICLPAYLGTSQYRDGDMCAVFRETFGEGEEGWHNYIKHLFPVWPTPYGVMRDTAPHDEGFVNTYLMAGKTYTNQSGEVLPAYPAADYCASISYDHDLLKAGKWQLGDMGTIYTIWKGLLYGVDETGASTTPDADPINRALNAIGGTLVPNGGVNYWSASRSGAYNAFVVSGSGGSTGSTSLFNLNRARPLVLLDVSEANS